MEEKELLELIEAVFDASFQMGLRSGRMGLKSGEPQNPNTAWLGYITPQINHKNYFTVEFWENI